MTQIRTATLLKTKYDFSTGQYCIDARSVPYDSKNGKELSDYIQESIRVEQAWIKQSLPSLLFVTQKQFASLNNFTDEMFHTTDRMFKVLDDAGKILTVMEVYIDDEYDTAEEIDQIKRDSEAQLGRLDKSKVSADTIVITPATFKDQF